ncbi:MAG: hypothetical protein HXL35_07520 [Prevotellaceae bacterium]|nr:hypothetical protein [Prevotellaceae bacterium]MBF1074490.1 hypothetical protein [Prevotellaceae bacterium]MBF1081259.1 hypothetical protein [Prevotellaceae bacterium]
MAAASSAVDGRHTHCLTAAVRVADGRQTANLTSLSAQQNTTICFTIRANCVTITQRKGHYTKHL